MNDISDKIIRLYTRLNSLKQNLPSGFSIQEKYVKEYHFILNELQNVTKLDLSEFKIPTQEIKHTMISYNRRIKQTQYSKEKYCERNFLMAKLDALLGYFQIKYLSQEKREIGFKPT